MKVRTKIKNVVVFFAYESHDGELFRSFKDLVVDDIERFALGDKEPVGFLTGYAYSPYYGCTERIDEKPLLTKPTINEVKKFIKGCKDYMQND